MEPGSSSHTACPALASSIGNCGEVAPGHTVGSFEDAEQLHRSAMAMLTPSERVNRAIELTELARSLAAARKFPRKSTAKKR